MEHLTDKQVEAIANSKLYSYKLEFPIEFDNKEPIRELKLKRFKGRHMRSIRQEEDEMEQMFTMIASSSGLTPDIVEEIDAYDLGVLGEICSVFFSVGPKRKSFGK